MIIFVAEIDQLVCRAMPKAEAGAETYVRSEGAWLHDWDYLKDEVHLSVSH